MHSLYVCTPYVYALFICMHSSYVCTPYVYALLICMHSSYVCTAHVYALLICMHSLCVCTHHMYALLDLGPCMHCLMRSAYRDHMVRCCIVYSIVCMLHRLLHHMHALLVLLEGSYDASYVCISMILVHLHFIPSRLHPLERWGAGVETHFQEI